MYCLEKKFNGMNMSCAPRWTSFSSLCRNRMYSWCYYTVFTVLFWHFIIIWLFVFSTAVVFYSVSVCLSVAFYLCGEINVLTYNILLFL